MNIKSRLQTALEMLLYLSGSFGYSMDQIRERFSLSERTVYRYLDDIKSCGFVVERNRGYYRVIKNEGLGKSISDLLHFSEEEAWILSRAIHSIDDSNPFKANLVQKLYSLYDFGRVAEPVIKKEHSQVIHTILQSVKEKKQLLLRGYRSSNSNIARDRLVEPIAFTHNFVSLWCFEPESMQNKLFRTSRVAKAEIFDRTFCYESEHREGRVDVFRISSFSFLPVKIRLNMRSHNLLVEEYPLSEKYITPESDNSWIFETEVCSFDGVGRFVMGLPGDTEILGSEEFRDYLQNKNGETRDSIYTIQKP